MESIFDTRISRLVEVGFTQKRTGMTNGKYSFLWHQLDTNAMTDEEFNEFMKLIKQQDNGENQAGEKSTN